MKITGRDVPPELAALYASIVSTALASVPGTETARRRVGAGRPAGRRRATRALLDMLQCCTELAAYLEIDTASRAGADWLAERVSRAWRGEPDPKWWQPAAPSYSAYWLSAASSVARLPIPPFTYRDPNNLPTIPTYGDPEEDEAPARYYGNTASGYFRDLRLCWHAQRFETPPPNDHGKYPPAWLLAKGAVSVTASHRGARPFFSLVIRAKRGTEEESAEQELDPPTAKVKSHYWRYIVPLSSPPYYRDTVQRRVVQRVPLPNGGTLRNWITTLTSPRPLMGKQYNNNQEVRSEWQGNERLMLPAPCIHKSRRPIVQHPTAGYCYWSPEQNTFTALGYGIDSEYSNPSAGWWMAPDIDGNPQIFDSNGNAAWPPDLKANGNGWTNTMTSHPDGWIIGLAPIVGGSPIGQPAVEYLISHTGETLNQWNTPDGIEEPFWSSAATFAASGHIVTRDGWARRPGQSLGWFLGGPPYANLFLNVGGRIWGVNYSGFVFRYRPIPAAVPTVEGVPENGEHTGMDAVFQHPRPITSAHIYRTGVLVVDTETVSLYTTAGIVATFDHPGVSLYDTPWTECYLS